MNIKQEVHHFDAILERPQAMSANCSGATEHVKGISQVCAKPYNLNKNTGPEYQGYDVPHGTQQVDTACLRRIMGSSEIHTMTRNALLPSYPSQPRFT